MKTTVRVLVLLLAVIMVVSMLPAAVLAEEVTKETTQEFAGGSGTAEDPYLISTKEHLNNVRDYKSAHFKMINDIEFAESDFAEDGAFYNYGKGWEPIASFNGTFDGNYYKIKNLFIDRPTTNNVGMFSLISSGARIERVGLINVDISGLDNVGAICGKATEGTFSECFVSGSVNGDTSTGGLIGRTVDSTSVSKCQNNANVSGQGATGGIVGSAEAVTGTDYRQSGFWSYYYTYYYWCNIANCANNGIVSGLTAGGIIGWAPAIVYDSWRESQPKYHITSPVARLKTSLSTGEVIGTNHSGGLVGYGFACETDINSYYLLNANNEYSSEFGTASTADKLTSQSNFTDWDFNTIWTMEGDSEYLYPELQCFVLSGALGVDGNVANGETVKPNTEQLSRQSVAGSYTWYVDGQPVHSGTEYTIQAADVGKKLTVSFTSEDSMCTGTVESESYVVEKGKQTASPVVPELVMLDNDKFEISTVATQEYSLDNENWQSGGLFEGLEANKTYTVYARILENDVCLTGDGIAVLQVTTGPLKDPSFKFAGASISLQHNIAVNYKVDKALFTTGGFTDPYVVFEMNGVKTTVDTYTVNGNRYVFSFLNIAPNQMNDTISATLYATKDGMLYGSQTRQYSVAEYCYSMLELYPGDTYAKLRTLLVDLLNYGAASQVYTGYEMDNLVNSRLTAQQKQWATTEEPVLNSVLNTSYEPVENPKATWRGAGLKLTDAVSVRLTFRANSTENLSVRVWTDQQQWILGAENFEESNGSYYVYFNGLHAGQMRETFYIALYEGDVRVSNTACYSIESYAYQMQSGGDFDLADLVIAMMKYGDSAEKYNQ